MRAWFFPSWEGDFRLIAVADSTYRDKASEKASVLQVVDPTAAEREALELFLGEAVKKNWTAQEKLGPEERQEILLNATIDEAGKVLITKLMPADRTITAVRSENGKITVQDTAELLTPAEIVKTSDIPEEKKPEKKEKAVSVKRPTPSCPQCVPGAVNRASEVLLSFLTDEEHESWARNRFIVVVGGITGHHYVVAHRHSPLAVRIGRICFDLDDSHVVHFHDNSVPPEEEVLAAKLILQHREPWLRNEATMLGGRIDLDATLSGYVDSGIRINEYDDYTGALIGSSTLPAPTMYAPGLSPVQVTMPRADAEMIFRNPFGDVTDGVWDAGLTQRIGGGIQGFLAAIEEVKKT